MVEALQEEGKRDGRGTIRDGRCVCVVVWFGVCVCVGLHALSTFLLCSLSCVTLVGLGRSVYR